MSRFNNLAHFRNLVSLAAVDGEVSEVERVALERIAKEKEIDWERAELIIKHADEYAYLIPQSQESPRQQLKEMIDLAWVDDEFKNQERDLILKVGERLAFSQAEILEIIEELSHARNSSPSSA